MFCNSLAAFARSLTASVSPVPIYTSPTITLSESVISFSVFSTRFKISSAQIRNMEKELGKQLLIRGTVSELSSWYGT